MAVDLLNADVYCSIKDENASGDSIVKEEGVEHASR